MPEPLKDSGGSADARQAVVVVRIGSTRWALPVIQVIEVLRDAPISRIPGAASGVRGLVNHRGRVVTVADPALALGLAEQPVESPEVVVLQVDGRRFGIAVDAVVELLPEARTSLAMLEVEQIVKAIFP
jgi:purine-binding chemotaxis protein CheW